MIPHTIEYISDQESFARLLPRLNAASALAVDIETVNWWSRDDERISIIQIGFREGEKIVVAVLDALGEWNPEELRRPFELSLQVKAIHNAGYDAVRLARHYRIRTSPVHDTMLAARRSGEKKCSLQAQVERHLGFRIEKAEQRGDWSRRPLSEEQLRYAALDAVCTLLLYEMQVERGLRGDYELNPTYSSASEEIGPARIAMAGPADPAGLSPLATALLSIVREFPGRYSPHQLAASAGAERSGMMGWILDRTIGPDEEIEETIVRQEISALCEARLIELTPSGRLHPPEIE